MFNAKSTMDSGDICMQKSLVLNGNELYEELRVKQANMIESMCLELLKNIENIKFRKQDTLVSYNEYRRRTPKDSQLDISKSLKEQFNLLRIVNNNEFPAFFYINGIKYKIKIYKDI